ncbi:U7 snRNA-associated Sm-like protein LSm11 [Melanotaenia boesemani]|uniref:U7 snRNA-associated Sm-like protein LSm11 n=1 Tax=Melanotaenia boesemani TaxID=1250792 RepID=UPI001C0428FC|nr:U7 snRNA-associated Sm-like protein LSm11 [Melanotaenia boesemani]
MEERERKSVKSDSKETVSAPSSSTASIAENDPNVDDSARDDSADQINVCSEKFNPLLALYCPSAPPLPFPNIKCFNNVAEYESFLKGGRGRAKPENVEKKLRKAMKGVADPERIERLKKLMVNNPVSGSAEGESSGTTPRRRQKPQKNVLTRMSLCKGGPLGELNRCVEERIRVKVHIRTFKGLRGVCSGFVVAFDKFWNMAMVDVDETYREPLFGEALYHEKALTISRLFQKLNLQESRGGSELVKKREAREKASEHQPANPKAAPKSRDPEPADRSRGGSTAESELSEAFKSKQDQHKVSVKACGPKAHPKTESQTYGKVHTRHINQLFIRGENVILVNLQPL